MCGLRHVLKFTIPPAPCQACLNAAADESGAQAQLRWLTQLHFLENRFEKLFDESTARPYMTGLEWESTFDGSTVGAVSLQTERMVSTLPARSSVRAL